MAHRAGQDCVSALLAERVTHRFGDVVALDDVTIGVEPGECVGLVGESGSGKTTLLGCFNRLTVPQAGRITVLGEDVATADPVRLRRRVGYVQQDGGLLPHWTVARNAALVPWLLRQPDAPARAAAALDLVGLPASTFGERSPSALSGGQRQRVAIARAIAAHPGVLLMDEPFGALDAITRFELQQAFVELRRRIGATVVLVTHDVREAFLLADRVAVFRAGRIEQFGTPEHLQRQPATPYVRRLLETAGV
jgi:osmoprotectant transport system ATP-binding protein